MFPVNRVGFVIRLIALGPLVLVNSIKGNGLDKHHGLTLFIGGILSIICDLGYRSQKPILNYLSRNKWLVDDWTDVGFRKYLANNGII